MFLNFHSILKIRTNQLRQLFNLHRTVYDIVTETLNLRDCFQIGLEIQKIES
jgi:hypothetical protein